MQDLYIIINILFFSTKIFYFLALPHFSSILVVFFQKVQFHLLMVIQYLLIVFLLFKLKSNRIVINLAAFALAVLLKLCYFIIIIIFSVVYQLLKHYHHLLALHLTLNNLNCFHLGCLLLTLIPLPLTLPLPHLIVAFFNSGII